MNIIDIFFFQINTRKFLSVVDVYSGWSGPCAGMISLLKKIKLETGGDALSYAIVIIILILAMDRKKEIVYLLFFIFHILTVLTLFLLI